MIVRADVEGVKENVMRCLHIETLLDLREWRPEYEEDTYREQEDTHFGGSGSTAVCGLSRTIKLYLRGCCVLLCLTISCGTTDEKLA